MKIPIMHPERLLQEILITMITMRLRLGLLEIHMLLHLREGLLLTHTLPTHMQHRQPDATLLLPQVRLPETHIMTIPTMQPVRMQHQRLLLPALQLTLTLLILTRDHLQRKQTRMQLLPEQTRMLAQTRMPELKL